MPAGVSPASPLFISGYLYNIMPLHDSFSATLIKLALAPASRPFVTDKTRLLGEREPRDQEAAADKPGTVPSKQELLEKLKRRRRGHSKQRQRGGPAGELPQDKGKKGTQTRFDDDAGDWRALEGTNINSSV